MTTSARNAKILDIQQQLTHWFNAGLTDIPLDLAQAVVQICRPDSERQSPSSNSGSTTADSPAATDVATTLSTPSVPVIPTANTSADLPLANTRQAKTALANSPQAEASPVPAATSKTQFAADHSGRLAVETDRPYAIALSAAERDPVFQSLQSTVAACERCPELCRRRTQTVFGRGSLTPTVCFLGEAPGADEDRLGLPFVGQAGQLLDRIIAASQLTPEQYYILNVAKCRPPNNRAPTDEEINNCWGYAEQQLEVLQPQYIVCLGATAARALLRVKYTIPHLREKFHQYRGSRVMVTYHPSYLLRTPDAKRLVWTDMKMLMNELGVKL